MKAIFKALAAATILGSASLVPAQALPLLETFSYSDGPTTVTSAGNWTAHSGVGSPFETTSTASDSGASLSYSGFPASAGSRAAASWGAGSREDIARAFTPQTTATAGVVYASALVKFTAITGTGEYFFHFKDAGTSNFRGRVFARASANPGFFNLGLRHGSADTIQYIATDYPLNQTVLVVLGLNIVVGTNNDTSNLWVNPTLGQPSAPAGLISASDATTADLNPVSTIALRLGTGGTASVEVDEIRVGNNWTDVTPGSFAAGVRDWSMY
jgi:hypothetical protein